MQQHGWFIAYVAVNALIVTLLALNVSRNRIRLRVANGDGGLLEMKAAIRAHGNAVEHMTVFGFVMLALSLSAAAPALQAILVVMFTLGRLMHAASMLRSAFNLRRAAAALVYLAEVGGCVALLLVLLRG
ncbi:MAG TPA: MAPEG family protein [Solimonas sp.]|nr:MAPEG family protein [Solimonas sp.]